MALAYENVEPASLAFWNKSRPIQALQSRAFAISCLRVRQLSHQNLPIKLHKFAAVKRLMRTLHAEEPKVAVTSTRPLLRWAGSKRKLLPRLLNQCPARFNRYFEPFAGSACLFFSLAPKDSVLGDFNSALIGTYKTVKRYPHALFKELCTYPINQEFYYDLRSKNPLHLTRLQSAARFIYLNRLCFNDVYRTNREGHFNVPFGSKTGHLPTAQEILSTAHALRTAELQVGDFEDTISCAKRGDFVYMDPPYASSRYRGEYGYGAFSSCDVGRLLDAALHLDKRAVVFLISYKADDEVSVKFSSFHQARISVHRHVAGFAGFRGKTTELLISNRPFKGEN